MNPTGTVLYVTTGDVEGGGRGAVEGLDAEYDVVVAEGGVDAAKRLAERGGTIECVVLETSIGDPSLDALVDRISREAPEAAIVAVGRLPTDSAGATALVDVDAYVPDERADELVARLRRLVDDARVDRAVDRHRRLVGLVASIAADVANADDRAAVETAVHDRLVGEAWYRHVWVGRRDEGDGLSVTAPVSGDLPDSELSALVGGGDPTFVSRAIETGRVVSTEGAVPTRGGAAVSAGGTLGDGGATTSLLSAAVPFVHDGHVWGVCLLSTPRDGAFDSSERALLSDLGAIVGHALWALESASSGGEEATAEDVENLIHELRNPLGIAQSHLEIAREDDEPEALDRVESALDRLANTIDRTSVGVGGALEVEESAGDLREDATLAWQAVESREAELEVVDSATFRADHDLVVRLLANLIGNAVEHGGPDVDVRVGTIPGGFFVEDDGEGIPEEEREAVMERGYSTAADGLGIGLNIVQDVAAAHGWEVSVGEGRDGGARFEIAGVDGIDDTDGEMDAGGDTDTSGNVDTDADGETDTDIDTDTDTDADVDADPDTPGETEDV